MGTENPIKPEAESTAVRCLSCFNRFSPPAGLEEAQCPVCGLWWRLTWVGKDFAKIRGPVWKKFPGLENVDI